MGYAPPLDHDTEQRRAAIGRSYMTAAIITMALYLAFWLPGAIANVAYLHAAHQDRRVTGVTPQGHGCLVALLLICFALPLLACTGTFIIPFVQGFAQGFASVVR